MSELIISVLFVVVGLYVIIKGSDYLIDGAADIARWLKVSPLLVGLTIVAFGTSLPEFIVTLFSVISGSSDVGFGTIIGSNITNLALGIGISAMVFPLIIKSKTLIYELPFLLVSNVLLLILANDFYMHSSNTHILGRIDGLMFMTVFVFFMYYIFRSMKEDKKKLSKSKDPENSIFKNSLLVIGGIVALLAGGKVFVNSAAEIALIFGVSQAFVGLTIAAIGTSLPEIIASIVAARKKQGDLAVGNIVGSNIFNILFVLGSTSVIKPFSANPAVLAVDGVILVGIVLLFLLLATSQKKITRKEGLILILTYIAYFGFLMWRL